MSVKEINNANTTKANITRVSVYTIHKYIREQLANKPTTTSKSMRWWNQLPSETQLKSKANQFSAVISTHLAFEQNSQFASMRMHMYNLSP